MARRTKHSLDEVKLTLARLQRITSESDGDTDPDERVDAPAQDGSTMHEAATLLKPLPGRFFSVPNILVGGIAAVLLIAAAGFSLRLYTHPAAEPEKTAAIAVDSPVRPANPAPKPPNVSSAITEAQNLIDTGRVAEARYMLGELAEQSPEAALMLARSYDPNFLLQVSQPNATADPKEAERWYRAWHGIAAQRGLVMEPDRLERIIKAMK